MRLTKKAKSKKREFDGWGSKPLRDFLRKIGKDSNKPISQNEVEGIIKRYATESNLIDPCKKKIVRCDTFLHSIFRRKSLKQTKIYNLLGDHFAENLEQSEEDESCCSDDNATVRRTVEKEKVSETPQSLFASVTAENIMLVYLKRSLVEDFLKNPETFDEKLTGSFIRVKSDPHDFYQKNPYQLMQVTGTTKQGGMKCSTKVTLRVSNARNGFQICMLSDENFLEEEVEDLHKKVKEGLLKKITIVELEQKARSLHEDITKHWIKKELARLQNLSDRANEKGWHRELTDYREELKKLRTESHQQQLIQKVPTVIAEKNENEVLSLDLTKDDHLVKRNSPMPILLPGCSPALVDIAAFDVVLHDIPKIEGDASLKPVMPELQNRADGQVCTMDTIKRAAEKGLEVHFGVLKFPDNEDARNIDPVVLNLQSAAGNEVIMDTVDEIAAVKDTEGKHLPMQVPVENSTERQLIVLDEKEGDMGTVNGKKLNQEPIDVIDVDSDDDDETTESKIWYYVDPEGKTQGTFSLSKLGMWYDDYFRRYPDFKIWKDGQSQEQAILLKDALGRS